MSSSEALAAEFASIDIYLFDQLLRGRIQPGMRILDAGCGSGRNLHYLARAGYEIFGVDRDPPAVAATRAMVRELAPGIPESNFRAEPIEAMTFDDSTADVVILNAVLHFALNDDQFDAMLRDAWRVLKPSGLFFCRLASTIGMPEERFKRLEGRRFLLPDGSERYLVDETFLMRATETLGATLVDPLKTTVVQNQRCMTTWVVRKST
jgi:SAM-dependent methyltransferase